MAKKWYAASVILYAKFKDGNQDRFPAWENVLLIAADSIDEAHKRAGEIAQEEEGDASGTFVYDGRPAIMTFAGVRKLIECKDSEHRPDDGTEVTYSVLCADNQEEFDKLVRGEAAWVIYQE